MVATLHASLTSAPASPLDEAGQPRFGAYAGSVGEVDLSLLRGAYARSRLYRLFHLKKWRWLMVATRDVMAAFAIVDVSYAANGFIFAADLRSRRVLVDASDLGLPGLSVDVGSRPDEGGKERFTGLTVKMSVERPRGSNLFKISARARGLVLDASLDVRSAPPPFTSIAPIPEGVINVTQKSVGLVASGVLSYGGRTYALDGGFGGFDYTHGLLARHTAWKWGFATGLSEDGRPVGFNLIAGHTDDSPGDENVLWAGSSMATTRGTTFDYDPANTQRPWRVRTPDGRVDLTFEPIGEHREERNLIIARSFFLQAFGTYTGTVDAGSGPVRVSGLPGVAEDQRITW